MKKAKRKELKSLRDSLKNKDKLSAQINERFLLSDIYKNAETILLYYSVGSEVSTEEIYKRAMSDKKNLAFPLCISDDGLMEFFYIKSDSDLAEGMYGIKAPREYCEKFTGAENALCVVPALSFDKKGYRLGYGKGYYDRFLENFEGISVGLCYDATLSEALPTDKYDKKVNYLITDKKTYKF